MKFEYYTHSVNAGTAIYRFTKDKSILGAAFFIGTYGQWATNVTPWTHGKGNDIGSWQRITRNKARKLFPKAFKARGMDEINENTRN